MKRKLLIVLLVLGLCLALAACGGSPAGAAQPEVKAEEPAAPPAPTITLRLPAESMPVGGEVKAEADVKDFDGAVEWSVSDASVATVDNSGTVHGLKEGTVTVTAALSGVPEVTAQAEIAVLPPVSALELAETELKLLTGTAAADKALEVKILPANAYYQELTFESSDTAIVSVDQEGVLHAAAPGEATVTVRSADPAYTEELTCTVTVLRGVVSIELTETESTLYVGDSLRLKATVLPEDADNKDLTWSSSDEAVATVDDSGSVKPVASGTAEIVCTAQDGSGTTAVCKVQVFVGAKEITLEESKAHVLLGGPEALSVHQLAFTVMPEDTDFPKVTWTSSDESIATVAADGTIKAVAPGRVTITAFSTDPKVADRVKASCSVEVGNAVQGLEIEAESDRVVKGKSMRLTPVFTPEDVLIEDVTWASSDENILTVDERGNVSAVNVGTATVTCTAADGSGVSAQTTLTVYQPVSSISSNNRSYTLFAGQSATLRVDVEPADATDKSVTWSSSDTSVATVDASGKVTAKWKGRCRIEATANDGSGRSCRFDITVEPKVPITVDSLGFGIYNANLLGITVSNLCSTKTIVNFDFDIVLYDYRGNTLNPSGSYSLGSDEYISAGSTVTIRRTLSGISQTGKVTITITGVKFSDGSYYSIPSSAQEVWSFTR